MKKRLLILLTIICMLFPNLSIVNGNDNSLSNNENEIVHQIEDMISAHYFDSQGQYHLGSLVAISSVDTNVVFYLIPIYKESTYIGTIELNPNGNITLYDNTILYNRVVNAISNDCIIYATGGIVYVDYPNEVVELYDGGYNLSINTDFMDLSYQNKKSIINNLLNNSVSNFNALGIVNNVDVINIIVPTIQPMSVVPTIESNVLGITKFVTQNGYDLCWAACVATIANYKKNLNLTAENVATAMNIGFNDGGTPNDMVNALSLYSLYYNTVNSKISWASVKNNINGSYPFIICLNSSSYGHAVTGYGYNCKYGDPEAYSSSRYINIWEPNGNKYTIQYNASSYTLIGLTWTWTKTIVD